MITSHDFLNIVGIWNPSHCSLVFDAESFFQRCSGVFDKFTKFTGKHLSWSLGPVTLFKKRLRRVCYFVLILQNF